MNKPKTRKLKQQSHWIKQIVKLFLDKSLDAKIEYLQGKNKTFMANINELEQCSRRNCLLLHEVKGSTNEDIVKLIIKTMPGELQSFS